MASYRQKRSPAVADFAAFKGDDYGYSDDYGMRAAQEFFQKYATTVNKYDAAASARKDAEVRRVQDGEKKTILTPSATAAVEPLRREIAALTAECEAYEARIDELNELLFRARAALTAIRDVCRKQLRDTYSDKHQGRLRDIYLFANIESKDPPL